MTLTRSSFAWPKAAVFKLVMLSVKQKFHSPWIDLEKCMSITN